MPRHYHEPPSYMQQRAELSAFDDTAMREKRAFEEAAFEEAMALHQAAREAGPAAGAVTIGAVPGQDGIVFEPSHHAADYAGFVSRDALERAHFEAPREAVARSEEGGIVPAPHAPTFDIVAGVGDRRHFEDDVRFQSREATGDYPLLADPTFYVQGGQDDRYLSTSMAANARMPTGQDAFVNASHKGKRRVLPGYEMSLQEITNRQKQQQGFGGGGGGGMGAIGGGPGGGGGMRVGPGGRAIAGQGAGPYYAQGGAYAAEDAQGARGPGQMAGYRAVAFKNGTPSMLASIGASVARNIGNTGGGGGAGAARPTRRETLEEARARSKASWTAPPPGTLPGYTGSMR